MTKTSALLVDRHNIWHGNYISAITIGMGIICLAECIANCSTERQRFRCWWYCHPDCWQTIMVTTWDRIIFLKTNEDHRRWFNGWAFDGHMQEAGGTRRHVKQKKVKIWGSVALLSAKHIQVSIKTDWTARGQDQALGGDITTNSWLDVSVNLKTGRRSE